MRFAAAVLLVLAVLGGLYTQMPQVPFAGSGPEAVRGTLDLRGIPWQERDLVRLDGEWEFYPGQLLAPAELAGAAAPGNAPNPAQYVRVPEPWERYELADGQDRSAYGVGTFRLKVLFDRADSDKEQPAASPIYGIRVTNIRAASALFVNGERIGASGKPGASSETTEHGNIPYFGYFAAEGHTLEIVVHVSNFRFHTGGIAMPILLGTQEQIQFFRDFALGRDMVVATGLFLLFLYLLILFRLRPVERSWLYFGLVCLAGGVYALTQGEKLLGAMLPWLTYETFTRIQFGIGVVAEYWLLLYLRTLFPGRMPRWLFVAFVSGIVVRLALMTFASVPVFSQWEYPSSALFGIVVIYCVAVMLKGVARGVEGAAFMVAGVAFIGGAALSISLQVSGIAQTLPLVPLFFGGAVFSQALLLSMRFTRAFATGELLAEKLLAADRFKDEFLANTSHEIRTPLHVMINISQSLIDGAAGGLNERQRENLELVVATGHRAAGLLKDILDHSRLRNGELLLHRRAVALKPVVRYVIELHRHLLKGKPVVLTERLSDALPYAAADEDRLVQILTNLIGNALKFTPSGEISVSAKAENGWLSVAVQDTGIGIPESALARIFDAYDQVGQPGLGPGASGGVGLGLNIVKRLVELHGGEIRAESAVGVGSTFTFTLQLFEDEEIGNGALRETEAADFRGSGFAETREEIAAAAETGEAVAAAEAVGASAPGDGTPFPAAGRIAYAVLVVDDDAANRRVLTNLLAIDGYSVVQADSGEAALRALEEAGSFDLVILDWMMPGMTGLETSRAIRRRWSLFELPVLMLTARSRPEELLAAFEAGANDFLAKPVEAGELRARLRTLLAMRRSVEEWVQSEQAFLQAQIKPHFLFNTLNTILAVSDVDLPKAQDLLDKLCYYLRGSFDFQSRELSVPLDKEMELVRAYLSIEQARFGGRLRVEIDYDPRAKRVLVPSLSLQPIVENAVRHGVTRKEEGGLVRIGVREEADGSVRVEVSDDGIGMGRELAESLLIPAADGNSPQARKSNRTRSGIGLLNIHRRLLHLHGGGLTIVSAENEGTSVSFRIQKTGKGERMPDDQSHPR